MWWGGGGGGGGGGYFVRRLGFELFEQLLRLRFGRQRHCSLYVVLEERHRGRVGETATAIDVDLSPIIRIDWIKVASRSGFHAAKAYLGNVKIHQEYAAHSLICAVICLQYSGPSPPRHLSFLFIRSSRWSICMAQCEDGVDLPRVL